MEFGHLIPIVAIVLPFVMVICIQVAKAIARTQQERMRCEVLRAAIERGQPLPADAFRAPASAEDDEDDGSGGGLPSPASDVRTGLICIGVGAGLYLMLGTFSIGGFDGLQGLRWVGAIPGFVGVALLVNGLITSKPARPARPAAAPGSDLRS